MTIKLVNLLENPEDIEKATVISTEYQMFKDNEVFIQKYLGNKAKGFFIEKSAYIIFEKRPNILIIVNKENFNREDFYFKDISIQIEGKSNRRINSFITILKNDIFAYKYSLFLLILIYILIFCTSGSLSGIENLNSTFVDIISIFIGMLFIFSTMFYKENELDETIKNGKAQEIFLVDKYIFILAMLSLIFVIISNGILMYDLKIQCFTACAETIKNKCSSFYFFLKYGIPEILTGIAIAFNYICFRSIIDYYLEKIKSNAINRHIKGIRKSFINDSQR